MEKTAHDLQNEKLNRLVGLWSYSLAKCSNRLFSGELAALLMEVGRVATDRLKGEGVVFLRPTPIETINAVLSYFTENGYFKSASAELLSEKYEDGSDIVRIREVRAMDMSGSCAGAHKGDSLADECFCTIMLRYSAVSAFGKDLRFIASKYDGKGRENVADAALVSARAVVESLSLAEKVTECDARVSRISGDFKRAISMSLDAIVSIDEGGAIILWNPSAERIFGYSEKEMIGRSVEALIPEEYRQQHFAGLKRFVSTGQSRLIGKMSEVEGIRKDGTVVSVELSLSAEREGGRWIFTSVVRDISERKKLEDELRQKLVEMERINKIMVGREIRMQEMRDEIKALRAAKAVKTGRGL